MWSETSLAPGLLPQDCPAVPPPIPPDNTWEFVLNLWRCYGSGPAESYVVEEARCYTSYTSVWGFTPRTSASLRAVVGVAFVLVVSSLAMVARDTPERFANSIWVSILFSRYSFRRSKGCTAYLQNFAYFFAYL